MTAHLKLRQIVAVWVLAGACVTAHRWGRLHNKLWNLAGACVTGWQFCKFAELHFDLAGACVTGTKKPATTKRVKVCRQSGLLFHAR